MAKIDRSSKRFKRMKMMGSSVNMSKGQYESSFISTPKRAATERASAALQEMGVMPEIVEKVSTDKMAFEMLNAIGYTVEVGQQNLTLIDDSPNQIVEVELNYTAPSINILEQNMRIMQSFPSECDPIYQMDDNLPDTMQQTNNFIPIEMAQTLDLVSTGFVFGSIGLQNTPAGQTSKYFNNQETMAALKKVKR